jgi:hypothetical protein
MLDILYSSTAKAMPPWCIFLSARTTSAAKRRKGGLHQLAACACSSCSLHGGVLYSTAVLSQLHTSKKRLAICRKISPSGLPCSVAAAAACRTEGSAGSLAAALPHVTAAALATALVAVLLLAVVLAAVSQRSNSCCAAPASHSCRSAHSGSDSGCSTHSACLIISAEGGLRGACVCTCMHAFT